jgi:O-antigen/teichoic acid export membrane protein
MIARVKAGLGRLLPKNAFARGVSVLVGGTAGAQLLMVLFAPLLTRLYSPEDFGLVAVYVGLLVLISVISSLCYEFAIPLPEEVEEAAHVVVLSLLIVVGTTLLSALAILFFGDAIADTLGVSVLAGYLWLLPVGVLLGGAYNVFNYWSVRTKEFTRIAGTQLQRALATLAIQFAAFKLGGVALLFAHVTGQSVGTANLARPALAEPAFKHIRWSGVKAAASRYQRFPIYSSWGVFANTVGLQLPTLMFASLFNPAAAGLYALTNRVLSLPMSLVGNAIGQVFFSNAAEAYRRGQVGPLVAQLHSKLAHIGLPPALVLVLIGPDLFALVFGEDWRQAGEFARWMVPWLYLVFVSSPLSALFAVMEKQGQGLVFQMILLITRVPAILFGAWLGDLELTIMLFAGASALCWLGFLFWVAHIAGNAASTMLRPTLNATGIALACAVPLMIGIGLDNMNPFAWLYALAITAVLIIARYWTLLKTTY